MALPLWLWTRCLPRTAAHPAGVTSIRSVARWNLAHDVATALTGSAVFLALALGVVITTMWTPASDAVPDAAEMGEGDEVLGLSID